MGEGGNGGPLYPPALGHTVIHIALGSETCEGNDAVLGAIDKVKELLRDDRGGRGGSGTTDVLQVLWGAVLGVFMVFEEGGTGGCMHQSFAQGVAGLPGQGRLLAPCSG